MINLDFTLWKPKCCLVPLDISDDEIPDMSMSGEQLCSHLHSLKCWVFSSANSVILFFEPECQYSPLASTCWRSPSPLPYCSILAQASVLAASGSIPVSRPRRRAVSWGPGNNKGVFSWWFFPSPFNISPPWCSQSMCAFSLLQSNKGNLDLSWEFYSQLFLKAQFFTYFICCLLVTVNGKPSHVNFCVSLKGAIGPRGQPVSISSLSHLSP